MNKTEATFVTLVNKLAESDPDIFPGKMMSSPGLKYKDKVFAFYNKKKEEMGFRLGPDSNPEKFGLKNARLLSPFKTKPPLKGWYVVDTDENNFWEKLAEIALEYTKSV